MKPMRRSRERGATLIIGLILIVLITLVVVSAVNMSSSNLKSVTNLQFREEALSAANEALELVISSTFTTAPVAQSINVDINKDGTNDFTVAVAQPVCIQAVQLSSPDPSDTELKLTTGGNWNTDWDLDATVTDQTTGAAIRVRQGVRVQLTDTQKTAVCA